MILMFELCSHSTKVEQSVRINILCLSTFFVVVIHIVTMAQIKITNLFVHFHYMDQPMRHTHYVSTSHKLLISLHTQVQDVMEKFTKMVV